MYVPVKMSARTDTHVKVEEDHEYEYRIQYNCMTYVTPHVTSSLSWSRAGVNTVMPCVIPHC